MIESSHESKDKSPIIAASNVYSSLLDSHHSRSPDPRQGQPYGAESTREFKKLILGQEVITEIRDRDKYGREVCVIRKDGKDMNLEMIKRGAAWAYRKYLKPPYASEYIDAESDARGMRLGLWRQSSPVPPWEFRKGMR